jgi:hypothetical protein
VSNDLRAGPVRVEHDDDVTVVVLDNPPVGLDVAWHARRRRDVGRDPRERYSDVADRLVEKGRLGQKTGAGWYRSFGGDRTRTTTRTLRC